MSTYCWVLFGVLRVSNAKAFSPGRRYVSDSGKTGDAGKLQLQNKQLENAVTVYRQRLRDLSELVSKPDLDKLLLRLGLRDICEMPPALENGVDHSHHHNNNNNHSNHMAAMNGNKTPDLGRS